MNDVFVWFKESLFVDNHSLTLARSSLRLQLISCILLLAYVKIVSSANARAQECVRQLGRSLRYGKNKSGPDIVLNER